MKLSAIDYVDNRFHPVWVVMHSGHSPVADYYFDNEVEALVYWHNLPKRQPKRILPRVYFQDRPTGNWTNVTPENQP